MLRFDQYVRPKTTREAYDLLQQNRLATVIGGMMWLRLSDRTVPVGIDLSGCDLNEIEETEDSFVIGAMVTLGQLEHHGGFRQMTLGLHQRRPRHHRHAVQEPRHRGRVRLRAHGLLRHRDLASAA
ncbi:MAG: FAD binding domain-containing protein [Paratractidigestivibacter faecalis]